MGKKYKDLPLFENTPGFGADNGSQYSLLRKKYVFDPNGKVTNFIKSDPQLEEILLEASSQISTYFPEAKPVLKYFIDQETVGESNIIISIPTIYSPQETSDRLDQLEDNWWLENEYRSEGKLSINVEFR